MRAAVAVLCMAWCAAAAGRYQIRLRLPEGGLFAREEMQIEFRVEDTSRPDPLSGFAPVIRAAPDATIEMPAMAGMPKFSEVAHAEGAPGDYGIHPTFAHGGEYRLTLRVHPPGGEVFEQAFTLDVADARPKPGPPRYSLDVAAQPKRPKAGEPVELQLVVRDRETGAVQAFDIAHEKLMHLVIVRKDLGLFTHEHPEPGAGGTFSLRYTFPTGGEYHLFADVAPRGAGSQVVMAKVKISGPEGPAFDIRKSTPLMDNLPARKTVPLSFAVPPDIEPYLGAAGHLMLVHEDGESFVHSHPADDAPSGGELHFLARLPKPGLYRGWLQVQRAGKIETTALVVRAEQRP